MISILVLATSAWGQTAFPHYCSDDPAAPPRPVQADEACWCVRHATPLSHTDDTLHPDWYGDVTGPSFLWPTVQPDSCFNVTNRVSMLTSWPFFQSELRDVLKARSHKIGHEHSPAHHWQFDSLNDAAAFEGCGGDREGTLTHSAENGDLWEYFDAGGARVVGVLAAGRGNVVSVVSRALPWSSNPIFVTLDSGEVWVLPPPHSGGATWSPPP